MKTWITTDVEVDLSEIDLDDLREELAERELDEGAKALAGEEGISAIVDQHLVLEWLRHSNPPQEIRDWYYETKGKIL